MDPPANLAAEIPHRGPMHLLDEAHVAPDGTLVARRRIGMGHPFTRGGRLLRTALIEMLAQAAACEAAAHTQVAQRQGKGQHVASGMLVAMRELTFSGQASDVAVGQTVMLTVCRERTVGPLTLCRVEARIGQTPIAQGRMSFHLTLE